jgi:hypothetical protein
MMHIFTRFVFGRGTCSLSLSNKYSYIGEKGLGNSMLGNLSG